jgi:hypothetical protein
MWSNKETAIAIAVRALEWLYTCVMQPEPVWVRNPYSEERMIVIRTWLGRWWKHPDWATQDELEAYYGDPNEYRDSDS